MALTKITGQVINDTTGLVVGVTTVGGGISATDGFFSGIVTAVGDASFSGNVSVGGTLTYEDVTNIDSVGLVTARNGIVVGSGITLSKDGDVFFTGIATGNGSGLTALNASNISSGTVPTARLGSGTASSSTFLRGDSTFQTVNTDLVSDTSPQLGGDLASNGNDINVAANDRVVFGTDKLRIKHTDSNADIENTTGNIVIKNDSSSTSEQIILQAKGGEDSIKATADGNVELYKDNTKRLETTGAGAKVSGYLQQTAPVGFCAYRYDTGTGNEYPIQDSSDNMINSSYLGHPDLQTPQGQLTTNTEFDNNGAGGSCFSHDGTKFTAPVAGVYYLSFHISLYVVSDVGSDNSVTWGWYKNGTAYPHSWSSHYSGLNMVQSTPWVLKDGSTTLTDAYEIGSPSHSAIFTLAANDNMRVGWSNMNKKLGIRSFTFSGFLLG